jgi:tetratricopeptide (TPR) repeat protein
MVPLILTGSLAVGGIGVAVLMLPGGAEQLAMLSRDGRYESAAALGNRIHGDGEGDPEVLAQLFDLNGYTGDPARAREAIDEYLRQRPDDVAMLRHAVAFFAQQQDFAAYLEQLERLVAADGRPAEAAALAALYRTHGRFDDEKRVLVAHRRSPLPPEAAERLGRLLARDGDYAEAAETLAPVSLANGTVRPLLFEVLMKDGQHARAAEMATGWSARGIEPASHAVMVLMLAQAGEQDAAERLAATFPRNRSYDPAQLAWALTDQRRFDLVKIVVRHWLAGADRATSARAAGIFVDTAAQAGALGEMIGELQAMLTEPGTPAAKAAMAVVAVSYARWGYQAIAPLRHLLSSELLMQQPLFGASLAMREGNRLAARYFLIETDLSDADEDAADEWYSLAETVFGPLEIAADLTARLHQERLSVAVYPFVQKSALAAGMADPIFALLRAEPEAPANGAGL